MPWTTEYTKKPIKPENPAKKSLYPFTLKDRLDAKLPMKAKTKAISHHLKLALVTNAIPVPAAKTATRSIASPNLVILATRSP
jgi:hypothetical protein